MLSPRIPALEGATVDCLIRPDTRTWDHGLIDQHFLWFEAQRIKAIPLCWSSQADGIIWPHCCSGEYSVKTGYKLLCEDERSMDAASSDTSNQKTFLNHIWKLRVPNKIKTFLWRVCSEALPTKENLRKMKILDSAECSLCQAGQELTFHATWGCDTLGHIWAPVFSWISSDFPGICYVCELIQLVGQKPRRLALFATVAWFIWHHRNKIRLKEECLPTVKVFDAASNYLAKYQMKFPMIKPKTVPGRTIWRPPMGEMYKTNFDGAIFAESREAGIGVVILNSNGRGGSGVI